MFLWRGDRLYLNVSYLKYHFIDTCNPLIIRNVFVHAEESLLKNRHSSISLGDNNKEEKGIQQSRTKFHNLHSQDV